MPRTSMHTRLLSLGLPLLAVSTLFVHAASAVQLAWVSVGDPGNPCDPQFQGCGAVPYIYEISQFEVTNSEYIEFLNAVAQTDPNGLYNTLMTNEFVGGITRSGDDGSYFYDAKPGFADKPVNFVSYYDSLRFANWLHNGQPLGAQGPTTTEDGAYTITEMGIANNSIVRNPGATVFLTSEDEWYKAAYYDLEGGYFEYPTATDVQTTCATPGATANTANCDFAVGNVTDVGAYTGSPSPAGTFDQGGNLEEWNETIIIGTLRGVRGGSISALPGFLSAQFQDSLDPASEFGILGFRIARLPEPGADALGLAAALGLIALRRLRGAALRPRTGSSKPSGDS